MILNLCPNPSIDCYAWLNKIEPGKVNRIEHLEEFPGGKGVHVAMALKELGEQVNLLGNWAGNIGTKIKEACIAKDLIISGVELEGDNRKCYTIRSSNPQHDNTEILEPGPSMNNSQWQDFKDLFEKELEKVDLACLSGSWPTNAPEDVYLQLILLAEKQHKKVFLDCSGVQLEEALRSSFFGLHLNEEEALRLCGSKDFDVLLDKLDDKVELVALTRGKEGLWMRYKGKTYIANVSIEKQFSTVGSGDCLTAGIAWAYERGLEPKEIASYGVACGAANCLNEDLGMIRRTDVNKLLPKVICKIVDHDQ